MFHTLTIASAMCASFAGLAPGNTVAPFRAGVQPEIKKSSEPDHRRKIIKDLQADYDKVLDNLSRADAGAETRKQQRRILDGLDKLLDQQDPESVKSSSKQAPKQAPAPNQAQEKSPRRGAEKESETTPLKNVGPSSVPPGKPEATRKEKRTPEGWSPDMPQRHRQAMDAVARGRFPPGYEELLRAYYRTLAESSREESRK